jgi:hypothetical protein
VQARITTVSEDPNFNLGPQFLRALTSGLTRCIRPDVYDPSQRSIYPTHTIDCSTRDDFDVSAVREGAKAEFSSYATSAFSLLRSVFRVGATEFKECFEKDIVPFSRMTGAVTASNNTDVKEQVWISADKKVIVRTISQEDSLAFRRILTRYFLEFLHNRETQMPRIFGLFRVKVKFHKHWFFFFSLSNLSRIFTLARIVKAQLTH